MPLFEYACRRCGEKFEQVVLSGAKPLCPSCESRDVSKLLSTFAVSSGGSGPRNEPSGGGCGSCGDPRGPRSCSN